MEIWVKIEIFFFQFKCYLNYMNQQNNHSYARVPQSLPKCAKNASLQMHGERKSFLIPSMDRGFPEKGVFSEENSVDF